MACQNTGMQFPVFGRRAARRAALAALLLAAALVVWVWLPADRLLTNLLTWAAAHPTSGMLAVAAIYVPACLLFVPGALLTLGAGYALGVVRGALAVSLGSTAGAAAAFLCGRTVAREWVMARLADRPAFRALDQAVAQRGWQVVLLARLSPVLPFNLLNYAFGLTQIRFREFVWASWLGMLPGTALYVTLGASAQSLAAAARGGERSPAALVLLGVGVAATLGLTILVGRAARAQLRTLASETTATQPDGATAQHDSATAETT